MYGDSTKNIIVIIVISLSNYNSISKNQILKIGNTINVKVNKNNINRQTEKFHKRHIYERKPCNSS